MFYVCAPVCRSSHARVTLLILLIFAFLNSILLPYNKMYNTFLCISCQIEETQTMISQSFKLTEHRQYNHNDEKYSCGQYEYHANNKFVLSKHRQYIHN